MDQVPWTLYAEMRGAWEARYYILEVQVEGFKFMSQIVDPQTWRVYQVPVRWTENFYRGMAQRHRGWSGTILVRVIVRKLDGEIIASSPFNVNLVCVCSGI